jgi:hypothetical protein
VQGSGGYTDVFGSVQGGSCSGTMMGVHSNASGTAGMRKDVYGYASGGDNDYGVYGV